MFRALLRQKLLCASTVGTFYPSVESGTALRPGLVLGRLRRLGRWYDVVAPPDAQGVLESVHSAVQPVEFGSPLFMVREILEGGRPDGLRHRAREKLHLLKSHLEGTLYQRTSPDSPALAPEGTRVRADDIIGVVEVMKTFTPLRAPISGVIKRWLVGDGAVIDGDSILVEIEPEESERDSG